jgi:hypothetical protein
MVTDARRDAILREARHTINRGRRSSTSPSADADGWESCLPQPPAAAAAPIENGDQVAAAAVPNPWSARMLRERRELEIADLERRAAEAERRQVEARHHQRAATASDDIEGLRAEVVELAKAANQAVTAVLNRMDAMSAEIDALRTRCAAVEGRTKTTRSKKGARDAAELSHAAAVVVTDVWSLERQDAGGLQDCMFRLKGVYSLMRRCRLLDAKAEIICSIRALPVVTQMRHR